jgi:hypothetical protein
VSAQPSEYRTALRRRLPLGREEPRDREHGGEGGQDHDDTRVEARHGAEAGKMFAPDKRDLTAKEREAERAASMSAKTARLREMRLAREAAERKAGTHEATANERSLKGHDRSRAKPILTRSPKRSAYHRQSGHPHPGFGLQGQLEVCRLDRKRGDGDKGSSLLPA